MKKLISTKLAGNILLIFFLLLAIFHILVLLGIIPSNIIWGGQIGNSEGNLFILEIVALVVLIFFAIVISMKTGYIKVDPTAKSINLAVWLIFAYFVLNTIGNLASGVTVENMIFAPITFILALLTLRLAIE